MYCYSPDVRSDSKLQRYVNNVVGMYSGNKLWVTSLLFQIVSLMCSSIILECHPKLIFTIGFFILLIVFWYAPTDFVFLFCFLPTGVKLQLWPHFTAVFSLPLLSFPHYFLLGESLLLSSIIRPVSIVYELKFIAWLKVQGTINFRSRKPENLMYFLFKTMRRRQYCL